MCRLSRHAQPHTAGIRQLDLRLWNTLHNHPILIQSRPIWNLLKMERVHQRTESEMINNPSSGLCDSGGMGSGSNSGHCRLNTKWTITPNISFRTTIVTRLTGSPSQIRTWYPTRGRCDSSHGIIRSKENREADIENMATQLKFDDWIETLKHPAQFTRSQSKLRGFGILPNEPSSATTVK